MELLFSANGNKNWFNHYANQYRNSSETKTRTPILLRYLTALRSYPTLEICLKNKNHHNKKILEHLCLLQQYLQ